MKTVMLSEDGFKEKNSNDRGEHRETGKTPGGVRMDPNNMLKNRLSTEARCFSLCKVKLNVVVRGSSWATV